MSAHLLQRMPGKTGEKTTIRSRDNLSWVPEGFKSKLTASGSIIAQTGLVRQGYAAKS